MPDKNKNFDNNDKTGLRLFRIFQLKNYGNAHFNIVLQLVCQQLYSLWTRIELASTYWKSVYKLYDRRVSVI